MFYLFFFLVSENMKYFMDVNSALSCALVKLENSPRVAGEIFVGFFETYCNGCNINVLSIICIQTTEWTYICLMVVIGFLVA